jgi:hypothetical protein
MAKKKTAAKSVKSISMKTRDKSVETLTALASEFNGAMKGVKKAKNFGKKPPLPPSANGGAKKSAKNKKKK